MNGEPTTASERASHACAPGDLAGFELVVFDRRRDRLQVTVQGMSASRDVDIAVFEHAGHTDLDVIGSWAQDRVRPYRTQITIDVVADRPCVVKGLGHTERIIGSQVPEDMPVVCGADPLLAELGRDFLHQRDGRYVLMRQGAVRNPARVA